MRTLIVDINDNGDIKAITEALRLIRGVKKVSVAESPIQPMSIEEYREIAEQALEEARQGRTISHEEMGEKMKKEVSDRK